MKKTIHAEVLDFGNHIAGFTVGKLLNEPVLYKPDPVTKRFSPVPDAVTEEDAAYLLRFKNPLEVVAAAWQEMNGSGGIIDDDMKHILWELRDRQDAEPNFEIEQEHFGWSEPSYPEMSM